MNILGIGGWEFVAILLIALIVAGPKRMLQWSYVIGKYMARLRLMWADTMSMIQKELDDAGVDVQLPKEVPTRGSVNKMAEKAFKPFTDPLKEAVNEVEAEAKRVQDVSKEATKIPSVNGQPKETPAPPPASNNGEQSFGTWSNTDNKQE